MLSNLSPRASKATASSAVSLNSTGVIGRVVVSAFGAVVATTTAAGGAASKGSPAGPAGDAASEGAPAGPAGGAASEGSPAGPAGGAASEGSPAGPAGGAASNGAGSIRGSPSMREATSRTAALAIDNALPSAISETSLMTPTAATGSVAGFLCKTTLMPAATTIPVAASQKRTSGKTRRATVTRDGAGLGGCTTSAIAGGRCSFSTPLRAERGLSRIPRAVA